MPKLTNFLFCEEAEIENNRAKAIDLLQVIETSTDSLTFSVIFSITGYDASVDHFLYIVMKDTKDRILTETDRFLVEKEELEDGMDPSSLITGLSMGVDFENIMYEGSGLYKVELFFDEEILGEYFIPVTFKREGDANDD